MPEEENMAKIIFKHYIFLVIWVRQSVWKMEFYVISYWE